MVVGERWSKNLLGSTICGTVVLGISRKTEATEHAEPVRIERQKAGALRKDEDLVGPGLPDHRKLGQGASGLGDGEAKRCSEIAIPSTKRELRRLPQAGGSTLERDGPTEAGDRLQLGTWSGQNVTWLQANLSSKRGEGSAALGVGHEIPHLLPEDQAERIPADRGRRLPVVTP